MTGPFASPLPTGSSVGGRPTVPAELVVDNPAFRAPSLHQENGYVDSPVNAYAPELRASAEQGFPDSRRIGQVPIREYRPDPARPPQEFWTGQGGPGRDVMVRHVSAEDRDAVPDHMFRGTDYAVMKRAAPDPRRTPPPETRVTSDLSPSTWEFTRPFDQHAPHRLTGVRFSMADHKRVYADQMGGMLPQQTRRNTFRLDPGPWDQAQTDYPVNTPEDWGGYRTAAVPMTNANRSYRLDA